MVYSARSLAFFLAMLIALISSVFLSLVQDVDGKTLVVDLLISFSASYIFIYVALEFLVFREISNIYKMMSQLKKKELFRFHKMKPGKLNPLKDISTEITSFALLKEKEIDELKRLEIFRKELIADISHELKTPIFAAQGFILTLLDGAVKDKEVSKKFLKKAAIALDKLDALVQDLLTLSKFESGDIIMKFSLFDICGVCKETIEHFENKIEKKKIHIKFSSDTKKLILFGDRKRINQVLLNLVSNALNYTPDGGRIEISCQASKKIGSIYVKDNGEGIAHEHLPHIFDRFYRADKSRSRNKGGTGLGLAIVKQILERHQSKIEVDSSPGKGSTFSFKLSRDPSY